MSEIFETLITDRPNKETYYNYTDLNRVEKAVSELAELLTAQGYYTTVEVKTDWLMKDKPSTAQMQRYLDNVKICVRQFNAATGITLPVSMDDLDYIGANNIEKTLVKINELLSYMIEVLRYSGTFYSGNMNGLRGYCL